MAKPLVLKFGAVEIPFALSKVERSDLYGSISIEAQDENGGICSKATLADDGCNLIAAGGISLATLSPDGNWLEKKSLTPTDNQGQKITPVPSSYAAPVPLEKKVTIEEYLNHDIRAVYEVSSEVDFSSLAAELKSGAIFNFPYSFRGGLEPDAGFLLMSGEGAIFFAVGTPTKLEFVGLEQSAPVTEEEDTATQESDDLDFSMM